MNLGHLIDRMIAAGVSPGEAGSIAAEIYAAGVASASTRSPGAERTRRWRENRASQSDGKRHETSQNVTASQASPNVTERHKASHCDDSPVLHREKNIRKSSMQNSERPSRGSRIAADWSPSPSDRQTAKDEGFSDNEIDREALRFRDYWTAKAGAGGVKLDWPATWRNWVRNSAEKLGKTPTKPTSPGGALPDGKIEVTDPEQLQAWDDYARSKGAKSFPRNSRGGWLFPSPWPPGYKPPERSNEFSMPRMQTMQ